MAAATQTSSIIDTQQVTSYSLNARLRARIQDVFVFIAWLLVTGFALAHHEKWADEAQSWLLARDLDLGTLWFKELRYEGSPGLWHTILWVAQHVFRIPYSGLGVIGLLFAAAGIAMLLFHSPFPKPIRWLMAFSYTFVYQYAVVARPYVLLLLIASCAAIAFKDQERPGRFTLVLAILANLSAHGILLSACLGLAYLYRAIRSWEQIPIHTRRNYCLCAAAMVLLYIGLFLVLKLPAGTIGMADVQSKSLRLVAWRTWYGVNNALLDYTPASAALLGVLGVWCVILRKANSYVLPILIVVMAIMYGYYGLPHHLGTIFTSAVAGLWIAWPTKGEVQRFTAKERLVHQVASVGLLVLLAYQTFNAAVAIKHEYEVPYSGAQDAVAFLKRAGGEHPRILGPGFGMVAIDAYFNNEIEVQRETSYYHNAVETAQRDLDSVKQVRSFNPDFIVIPCFAANCEAYKQEYNDYGRTIGYPPVHFSDGYLLDRRGWSHRHAYFIFRKAQ